MVMPSENKFNQIYSDCCWITKKAAHVLSWHIIILILSLAVRYVNFVVRYKSVTCLSWKKWHVLVLLSNWTMLYVCDWHYGNVSVPVTVTLCCCILHNTCVMWHVVSCCRLGPCRIRIGISLSTNRYLIQTSARPCCKLCCHNAAHCDCIVDVAELLPSLCCIFSFILYLLCPTCSHSLEPTVQ